ncbi:hypothetical protein ACVBEH_01470 [Roseateles sp. GG27B]
MNRDAEDAVLKNLPDEPEEAPAVAAAPTAAEAPKIPSVRATNPDNSTYLQQGTP